MVVGTLMPHARSTGFVVQPNAPAGRPPSAAHPARAPRPRHTCLLYPEYSPRGMHAMKPRP